MPTPSWRAHVAGSQAIASRMAAWVRRERVSFRNLIELWSQRSSLDLAGTTGLLANLAMQPSGMKVANRRRDAVRAPTDLPARSGDPGDGELAPAGGGGRASSFVPLPGHRERSRLSDLRYQRERDQSVP